MVSCNPQEPNCTINAILPGPRDRLPIRHYQSLRLRRVFRRNQELGFKIQYWKRREESGAFGDAWRRAGCTET